jgi:NAD(P)-dependent dehydrogenase (short-subunit alcohol dehydrogenase family)
MTQIVKGKTMIVTGASQGIGDGVTKAFIKRGYNVVANSRKITESEFTRTDRLVLVDGNIGEAATAAKIATTAVSTFGSIDGVVNNAGIFFSKRFTSTSCLFPGCRGEVPRPHRQRSHDRRNRRLSQYRPPALRLVRSCPANEGAASLRRAR